MSHKTIGLFNKSNWALTVRSKLIIFLCAVSLLPLLLASRVLVNLGGRSSRTLAELQARDGAEQCMAAFQLAETRLVENTRSVAEWGDLAKFCQNPSKGWADKFLLNWAPQAYKLDYLTIFDNRGQDILNTTWRPDGLHEALLSDNAANTACIPDSLELLPDSLGSGWISISGDLLLMARQPIRSQGQQVGMLVFGRRLTHQFLQDVNSQPGQKLYAYYGDRLLATTDTSEASALVDPRDIFPNLIRQRETYLYYAKDPNRIIAFRPLHNLHGEDVAAIGWRSDQSPSRFVQESINQMLLFFGIPLVLVVILAAAVLGLWIERPIRRLAQVMERIRRTADLAQRAPVAGGDEIASMSNTFNQMLEQLAKQRDELLAFRTMILTMREGVLIEDDAQRIIYMNPRMEELLGVQFELTPATSDPYSVRERIIAKRIMAEDERGFKTEEVFWDRPDGSRVQALKTSGKLDGIANGRAGILSTFVDITERNELELELIQASRMAFLGLYSQGIIHNLNGPLNTVLGFSALMCRNQEQDEIPQRIHRDAQRMADLISSLARRWQRSGGGRTEELNLNEIIKEELGFLEADLFFKHNVEKALDLEENLPTVRGIYGDFSHAILNVLINAVEAMMESPVHRLSVQTRSRERAIEVRIEDTGVGISAEDLERIFLPFFSTKDRERQDGIPGGAGLGLSIARKILEPYGAEFEVHSREREGTEMILLIPLRVNQECALSANQYEEDLAQCLV